MVIKFRVQVLGMCRPVISMGCHLVQDLWCKAARATLASSSRVQQASLFVAKWKIGGRLGWEVRLGLVSRPSLRSHAFTSWDMSRAFLRHHVLLPSAHRAVPSICAVRTQNLS